MKFNDYILFLLILFFLGSIVITSCEFEPSGEYFVDKEPITTAPLLEIDLNFQTDTLYLPSFNTIKLKYRTEDELVKYALALIDEKEVSSNEFQDGKCELYFYYNVNDYDLNKAYKLKLTFFRNSGTNSMADKLDMEGFVYSKEFDIIFLDQENYAPQIKQIGPKDGSLELSWDMYKGLDFEYYVVLLSTSYGTGIDTVAKIYNQNQTSCMDQSFIGFQRYYYVKTVTSESFYKSKVAGFKDELPQIFAKVINEKDYLIHWQKSKYINNIKEYKLFESFNNYYEPKEIKLIENNLDTSYIYTNGKFGVKTYFNLLPIPIKNPPDYEFYGIGGYSSVSDYIYLGEVIPRFLYFNSPLGKYCYYENYKFDCDLQSFTDSINISGNMITSSPNGKYLLKSSYDIFYLFNSENLELLKTISISDITGNSSSTFNYAISNNGIVVLFSDKFYLYDFENDTKLGDFNLPEIYYSWSRSLKISPDGNHCLVRYKRVGQSTSSTVLLKHHGDTASIVWEDDAIFYQFDFLANNFVCYSNNTLTTRSLSDLGVVDQLPVNVKYVYNIDYNNNELIALNNAGDEFIIYDIASGEILYTIPTDNFEGSINKYKGIQLSNKTVFVDIGAKMKLIY